METHASVLVTGGSGYIGAPTAHALARVGYDVTVFDLRPLHQAPGYPAVRYIEGDIRNPDSLARVMALAHPAVVVHLAAKTSVVESETHREDYSQTNSEGIRQVLLAMRSADCPALVFASSAAVYAASNRPLEEDSPCSPVSHYGKTKLDGESLIRSTPGLASIILRYFNVSGATEDGLFAEPIDGNAKLIPSVIRALRDATPFRVYGNGYPTPDGTAVRDFISLDDVVRANCLAVASVLRDRQSATMNIGSGHGSSVLEVVKAVGELGSGSVTLTHERSRNEAASSIAAIEKAASVLGWSPPADGLQGIIGGLLRFYRIPHQAKVFPGDRVG